MGGVRKTKSSKSRKSKPLPVGAKYFSNEQLDRLFERSPSPVDEDGQDTIFNVTVISEEVDADGEVRYEIRWDGWSRQDGSNTTWHQDDDSGSDLREYIRRWKHRASRARNRAAQESKDVKIFCNTDFLLQNTHMRQQAMEEKITGWTRPNLMDELQRKLLSMPVGMIPQELRAEYDQIVNPPAPPTAPPSVSSRTGGRSGTSGSRGGSNPSTPQTRSSDANSLLRLRTRSSGSASPGVSQTRAGRNSPHSSGSQASGSRMSAVRVSERLLKTPSSSRKTLTDPTGRPSSPPSSSQRMAKNKVTPVEPRLNGPGSEARNRVADEWTAIARESGASPVLIVNQVDNEELPPDLDNFTYMESGYKLGKNVILDDSRMDFQLSCDCPGRCDDDSCVHQHSEDQPFPYDEDGYFIADGLSEIIECNDRCSCADHKDTCLNRVAQRPRSVPIEIFKTRRRGWGVRCTGHLTKGQVIGTYSGMLISRRTAEKLVNSTYVFDLDGHEEDGVDTRGRKYSVNATHCGNWSRFLNHSCDPNVMVVNVIWDYLPEDNMPYITFIAQRDIPARQELTFDYSPNAEPGMQPEDGQPCNCGSENCKGVLY